MKLIVKTLLALLFAGPGSTAWAVDGCGLRGCGQYPPRVDGVRAGTDRLPEPVATNAASAAGFRAAAIRVPQTSPANDRGPVRQLARFIPVRGQNLNSPLIGAAAVAGVPFHAVALMSQAPALPLPVGTTIELRDAGGARYDVLVSGHGRTRFWAGSDAPVTTHVLLWSGAAQARPQPLCAAGANEAILFTGDRYDARRKTVTATGAAADGVLNIACAGSALAKLYLMRHTEASQEVATTRAERQAMLKMLTADVYGDGHSFTVANQPLHWSDAKRITRMGARTGEVEAVWNEHGALCLNVPRIAALEGAITAHGQRPPRCTDVETPAQGYVVSAHPS